MIRVRRGDDDGGDGSGGGWPRPGSDDLLSLSLMKVMMRRMSGYLMRRK